MQCHYDDKEFGRIIITFRRGMRRVVCRWRGGRLHLSVPFGLKPQDVVSILGKDRAKIRALNHGEVAYHDGQVIPCFRTSLSIGTDSRLHNQILQRVNPDGTLRLLLPADADFASPVVKRAIGASISYLLERAAGRYLLPFAQEEARRLGLNPLRFEIGRGKTKLGHCTPQRVIQLSRFLMLMPEPLVRCVVCHELAHLTHMDHSPAFYALLDEYLDGHRAELDSQIDHFEWPIER